MEEEQQQKEKEGEQLPSDNTNTSRVILGKYELGRQLGQGTFAKVYLGKKKKKQLDKEDEEETSTSVAIKVVSKDKVKKAGAGGMNMMDQIQREISVMSLVRHPNIVELKEVMATKSKIFFVMEYVKGGELFAKVVKGGKVDEDEARKYFQQLISAVDFCHSRGVTHRDIKPENLLLDENGDLKVSDFGLSALPDQRRQDGLLHTQCGTPAYVAPEVLRKKGYAGDKADLWSCGVVLFVLLSGTLPFQGENVVRMYRKVFKADYQFPPWFSDGARRLVSKLLVVDPDKRISVQGIMADPWFDAPASNKGYNKYFTSSTLSPPPPPPLQDELKLDYSPARLCNAFEFISSLSSGFDLSNLLLLESESDSKKGRTRSHFTAKLSAEKLVRRLDSAARKLNFWLTTTTTTRKEKEKESEIENENKNNLLSVISMDQGRKGRLEVVAEVVEVAPELSMVELSKCSGDTLEYVAFCDDQVRPALKDILWTWHPN